MKRSRAVLGLGLLAVVSSAAVLAQTASAAGGAPRVINVTPDSEKGWVPSEDLERQARKTVEDFLADKDSGRAQQAYARMAEIDRKDQPLAEFSDHIRQFNAKAGGVIERRIMTLTWTKNPSHAPL